MIPEQLRDSDYFFFYGDNELADEISSDLQQLINQPSRSLFYNRSNDAAGIDQYENVPNVLAQTILIPYTIVDAISRRNTYVGDGQNGTRDRRIVASQSTVKVESEGSQMNISVFYIPLFNINDAQQTTVPYIG